MWTPWNRTRDQPAAKSELKTTLLARKAVAKLPLEWWDVRPGHWQAAVRIVQGYTVTLHVLGLSRFVMCQTKVDLSIERTIFSRELALQLLEMNNAFAIGSNRLERTRESVSICHGQLCDVRCYSPSLIAEVAVQLVDQMSTIVTRLYAEDFIGPGPEYEMSLDLS